MGSSEIATRKRNPEKITTYLTDTSQDFKNIDEQDLRYLQKCLFLALKSGNPTFRHSSIIVDKVSGKIVSTGYNQLFIYKNREWTIHSEVDALRKLNKKINKKNLIMYNLSIDVREKIRISKPCVNCWNAICKAGIRRVYYTE